MDKALKPLKYSQTDLFVCDITDVILKGDMASMEYPFYSLTKKPDMTQRRFEFEGRWIEFRPSIKGLPTIYDKDLIIYAISQLIAGIKEGRPISKTVEIDPYAFLVYTQRGTGGRDYDALCDSLDRLDGTRMRTNVVFDGKMQDRWLGIIDSAALETDARSRKPRRLKITLSDMVMDAVANMEVLTLHRDYFRLKKPIERRVYELARKHCGRQSSWRIGVEKLHKKSGSQSRLKEFRRALKHLIEHDHLPDYEVRLSHDDKAVFVNRQTMPIIPKLGDTVPPLKPLTYQKARDAAPGWDIYYLEAEWRGWITEPPRTPNAAFIGFCKKWFEQKGLP